MSLKKSMAQVLAKMGNQLVQLIPLPGSVLRNYRNTWKSWIVGTVTDDHKTMRNPKGAQSCLS